MDAGGVVALSPGAAGGGSGVGRSAAVGGSGVGRSGVATPIVGPGSSDPGQQRLTGESNATIGFDPGLAVDGGDFSWRAGGPAWTRPARPARTSPAPGQAPGAPTTRRAPRRRRKSSARSSPRTSRRRVTSGRRCSKAIAAGPTSTRSRWKGSSRGTSCCSRAPRISAQGRRRLRLDRPGADKEFVGFYTSAAYTGVFSLSRVK